MSPADSHPPDATDDDAGRHARSAPGGAGRDDHPHGDEVHQAHARHAHEDHAHEDHAHEDHAHGEHEHDHHGHDHDHGSELSEMALRVRALESLLVEKGYVDEAALDELVQTYEKRIGPRNGAMVVARSWTDPAFRQWLLRDASAAIHSMGFTGRQGEHMVAVENTPQEHNLVVCTLCSCYPWPVLGLPPTWYKSPPYRSRAVIDPRGVLADFGVHLPAQTRIRVWDSTAEVRYLVIPMRPAGTDGWGMEELAALVSRDAMIGTAIVAAPALEAAS